MEKTFKTHKYFIVTILLVLLQKLEMVEKRKLQFFEWYNLKI